MNTIFGIGQDFVVFVVNNPELSTNQRLPDCSQARNDGRGVDKPTQ
ncbi:MAG: hypothetical protein LBT50_11310 [Prevotellaceae bacterium]|nr:hypothetical protein [Prevotellaceae bacterium]